MIILDARKMVKKSEAHEYLKQVLDLPDYYGKNLDALHDCLTEMNGEQFGFIHEDEGGDYFRKVMRVFKDAVRENESLSIVDEWPEEENDEL